MTTPPPTGGPSDPDELRDRLAAPAPPAGVLDTARDAALAAFDDQRADPRDDAEVTSLSSARTPDRRSATWYRRLPLGAVAAAIAVIALVGALTQVDLSNDDADTAASDTADSFEDTGAESERSASDGADDSGGDDESISADDDSAGEPSPAAGAPLVYYGDIDALVDDLADRYGADGTTSDPARPTTTPLLSTTTTTAESALGDAGSGCDAVATAGIDPASVVAIETVAIGTANTIAETVVYESDAGLRVAVVAVDDCALLDDRAL